jgi:uncharacterized protein (DUF2235 family)
LDYDRVTGDRSCGGLREESGFDGQECIVPGRRSRGFCATRAVGSTEGSMSKRLVVCCDGTWNRPDQHAPTNVPKVAVGLAGEDGEGTPQLLHYQQGVGTRRFERLRGGAFGVGLSRNVRDCYRFLVENYEPGDELYFFGFSRGAYTARSTVGLVRNSGILRREHVDRIKEAYRLYRGRAERHRPGGTEAEIFRKMYSREPDIRFVGVWDTVGSVGIPLRVPFADRLWGFHDTQLSRSVRSAYQALAIDEKRGPFRPTLWEQHEDATDQTLEQVWFAGVHSDVGGGYHEPALAEIALLWMVERARDCGLAFKSDHFSSRSGDIEDERRRVGAEIAPDALGQIHDSLKGIFRLAPPYPRPLTDRDGSAVASSAVRRRHEVRDYDPPGLDEYLAADKRVKPVKERP